MIDSLVSGKLKFSLHSIVLFYIVLSRINNILYENRIFFILSILLAGIGILERFKNLQSQPKSYLIWMFSFLSLYIVSSFWAVSPVRTWNNFIATLGRSILLIYVYVSITNIKELKRVVSVFANAITVNNVFILLFYGPDVLIQARLDDVVSVAGNANTIGMSSAFALMLLFFISRLYSVRVSKVRLLQYLLLIITIILTGSKKAFFILIFAFCTYYYFSHRNKMSNAAILCLILVITYELIMNVSPLYMIIGQRIESVMDGLMLLWSFGDFSIESLFQASFNSSDRVRMDFIIRGFEWIKERPFFGYGMANFIELYGQVSTKGFYAHNNYVEIAVGLGFTGLILYYSMYFSILKNSLENLKAYSTAKISMIILILCMILDLGLVSYLELEFQVVFMIAFLFSIKPQLYEGSSIA